MDEKKWYLSKGIWGALVTMVVGTLTAFGVGDLEGEQESITELIMQIVVLAGGFVALYGRITAKTKIERKVK